MTWQKTLTLFVVAAATASSSLRAWAQAPASALQAVPIHNVSIDDPFWSPKLAVWRGVTITDCLNKFDRDGTMANFDHVARGELTAKHGGAPWFDGLIYEMIRASADFLAEHPDPALEARVDGMIDRISAAAARDPDGFINTYTQLTEPTHRWGQNGGNDLWQHDLYNAGCLVDAAVHYCRATGKTKLLETAVRLANLMCKTMGPPPRRNIVPGHAIGEEAMIGLYRLFQDHPDLQAQLHVPVNRDDYLALAQFWIDARGHHDGRKNFGAYDQDEIPVLQQTTIEGHAVRAALLGSGLTSLGIVAARADYAQEALRLWKNMTGQRMYITGGVGSFADQERFGPDYVLPNNGYAETCAAVANGFFDENINLATGDASACDELERTLYNGALAGVSLAGNSYFYENPLACTRDRLRWDWHSCPCCPPMFLKLMSALPGYIYATDSAGGVYVNLYIGSHAKIDLADRTTVAVSQATQYPWSGDVSLKLTLAQASNFALHLRVPGWCRGTPSIDRLYTSAPTAADAFAVSINGQPVKDLQSLRGYATLNRRWQTGDVVEIHMKLPIQRVRADARVEADRGRITLMRGPIVYCLESIDNGGSVNDLFLPNDAAITAEQRDDLLNDVTVLHARAQRLQSDGSTAPADMTAIPYYANANRGPVSMTVWIPTDASGTKTF